MKNERRLWLGGLAIAVGAIVGSGCAGAGVGVGVGARRANGAVVVPPAVQRRARSGQAPR